jgi:hypothetical protein
MKQYKKLLLISGLMITAATGAKAQNTAAKVKAAVADPTSGVAVFHYIAEKQRHYTVSNCVPGSDVDLYTNPSGGSVAATTIADKKGEAHFLIDAATPVAFAINHSRVNEQGIAGSGKVMPVKEPVLEIDNIDAVKIGDAVQLSWSAGVLDDNWAFTIQKSEDNHIFTDVATVDARNVKNLAGYAWTDKNADAKSVLFYRVEARNTGGNKAASSAVAVKITGKQVFAVQPTMFSNTVQVTVPGNKLPATYSITDITGRIRLTSGVINAVGQKVTLSSLSPGTYTMSVTNKEGKNSVQLIFKQ